MLEKLVSEAEATNLAGVVLAAGKSIRFGGDKRLAPYDGEDTLLSRSIALAEPFCERLFVVIKPTDQEQVPRLLARWWGHEKVAHVLAPDAHQGMGASLANAMAQLRGFENKQGRQFTGVLVALADMPYISSTSIAKVVVAHAADKIILPCYGDGAERHWGHPVLFGRLWFDALCNLRGDHGGRSIIQRNANARVEVRVNDPGIVRDVDRPEDIGSI